MFINNRKTYVYRNGVTVDKATLNYRPEDNVNAAPIVQVDAYGKNPVVSPVDWKPIDSRGSLRQHNRRNRVVDIGDDRNAATDREHWVAKKEQQRDLDRDLKTAYQKIEQNNPQALAWLHSYRERQQTERYSDVREQHRIFDT